MRLDERQELDGLREVCLELVQAGRAVFAAQGEPSQRAALLELRRLVAKHTPRDITTEVRDGVVH